MERPGDELREVFPAGEHPLARGREGGQRVGLRQQVLHGIDAQHGGEQRRHRGQGADLVGHGVRDAVLLQAAVSVLGRLAASPAIISEKNTPIDSAVPEFWKVERMPEAAPR